MGLRVVALTPPPENFPAAVTSFNLVIDKEETEGFELGLKSTLWDGLAIFNAAVFSTQYEGLQSFQFDPVAQQITINIDEVDIFGYEAELVVAPTEQLALDFSYGYTDSEIKDFDGTGRNDGNDTPNTPDYTMNIGAQYEWSTSNGLVVTGRIDWRQVGEFYWQETNELKTPGYDFINLNLRFEYAGFTVNFWGKNLTDEKWAVAGFSRNFSPLTGGGEDTYTTNQGRQIGVDLQMKF